MSQFVQYVDHFVQSSWVSNIGWVLLHSIWQIAVVTALFLMGSFALRHRSASLRYLLGCTAMVGMLILPAVTFYLSPDRAIPVNEVIAATNAPAFQVTSDPESMVQSGFSSSDAHHVNEALVTEPAFTSAGEPEGIKQAVVSEPLSTVRPSFFRRLSLFVQPLLPVATGVWLLGVSLLSLRPVFGCLRVQTLRKNGLTSLSEATQQLSQRLVDRLGLKRVVRFAQSSLVEVPTVVGYLRPMVLLPASAVSGLTTAELELILAHELAHIRRHDYLVNLIQTVVEALLFYHPGMWWVSSHVRRERENCCDDIAVAINGKRATYIRALAQLEQHRIAAPALAANGGSLLMRVRRLLGEPQPQFGYHKSSAWLTVLTTVGLGLVIAVGAIASQPAGPSNELTGLAKLTSVQERQITDWTERVVRGELSKEQFAKRLEEVGPKSVQALVPLMDRGRRDQVAMDGVEQFLDRPEVCGFLEHVLLGLPADPNKPANRSHCCLSLLAKCSHRHPASSEANHVNLAVKFLKVNPNAALWLLGNVKTKHACQQTISAFDQLPTEHWWQVANVLGRVGDAAALPDLRKRLREVELPPNDRFPNITVSAFTDAIYDLSAGKHSNSTYSQGISFAYPYDSGTPKSFTVSPINHHYIQLPKVDSPGKPGRSSIWKAFDDQTPSPGFTFDGDEMVLLNGLRAFPLNSPDQPPILNRDKWLCEQSSRELIVRFNKLNQPNRVKVSADGWMVAMDPDRTVCLLKLKQTSDNFTYDVTFSRRLPLVEANAVSNTETPEVADSLLDFDKQVGQKVAQVVREASLPFVDEAQLAEIEADFTRFVSTNIQSGTFAVGASIPAEGRDAILVAIQKHGAMHLHAARSKLKPGDFRSINFAYLELPDSLLTLKWKLHQAIVHARTLGAKEQARLAAQRSWMRQYIQSLPKYKFFTHELALAGLDERLADPLCVTLAYPMTDAQFDLFRKQLGTYTQASELAHVTSHIVQQSLEAQYRDFGDFELPFDDRLVSYGAGRVVHLGFQSNRFFVSSMKSIRDIEESGTVIDATDGHLVTAPKGSHEPAAFARWLGQQEAGDFGFDDVGGGSLIAVRSAKLVKLNVETWVDADAITNRELQTLLDGPTAGRSVSLKKHYNDYQQDNGASYCYVGVMTQEGRMAVVAVEDFSGRKSIGVRTRVRNDSTQGIAKKITKLPKSVIGNPIEIVITDAEKSEKPSGESALEPHVAQLIISKERDGQLPSGGVGYSLDGEQISVDQLQERLQEKRRVSPQLRLVIHANPELAYQTVSAAMQLAKAAGVEDVRITTGKKPEVEQRPGVSSITSHADGTVSCVISGPSGKPLRVCFDGRTLPEIQESSWKVAGNMTRGRLFAGADHPDKANAILVERSTEQETQILRGLNLLLTQDVTDPSQQALLKVLASQVGQYQRVFVESGGVDVQLTRQLEQANPSWIPPLLITAVNYGDDEELTLGRTDQAFELEVDGKWYRQGQVGFKSSPLPLGRIYEPFSLTVNQRWLHNRNRLKLSPGKHTIRVRCTFGNGTGESGDKPVTATSEAITVKVGTEKVETDTDAAPE